LGESNYRSSELKKWVAALTCLVFLAIIAIVGTFMDPQIVSGAGGSQNVTVRLNVSNTEPILYQIIFDDNIITTPAEIVLNAGEKREVICNASVSDLNGQSDIWNATASIYTLDVGFFAQDSNSTHYTNSSCLEYQDVPGTVNNRSMICRFNVDYFAQNTTWECNITVRDGAGLQPGSSLSLNTSGTARALIDELVAINTSVTILDFGNLSVTETSPEKSVNITNAGNTKANFTVLAYGGSNMSATGVGNYSMLCETGNISINLERYSNVTGTSWGNMIPVNGSPVFISNVTLLNRTDEINPLAPGSTNATYWRVKVPLSVGGLCNGTLQFAATKGAN
jgi:hypothetical protein